MRICRKFEKEKFDSFTNLFLNRILTHNDVDYLILNIYYSESNFKCLKLYDKNGIKIDINNPTNLNNAIYFSFDKLLDNCLIHNKEESDTKLDEYKRDDKNILKIYYELLSSKQSIEYIFNIISLNFYKNLNRPDDKF